MPNDRRIFCYFAFCILALYFRMSQQQGGPYISESSRSQKQWINIRAHWTLISRTQFFFFIQTAVTDWDIHAGDIHEAVGPTVIGLQYLTTLMENCTCYLFYMASDPAICQSGFSKEHPPGTTRYSQAVLFHVATPKEARKSSIKCGPSQQWHHLSGNGS